MFLTLAGCGQDAGPAPVTFWQDVAPVVSERCVSCHQAGGIGPFRLDSYEMAKPRAGLIAAAVKSRTMPPWLASGEGTCGDFKGSLWLSETEIQTITRWAEGGAVEGTPHADLQPAAPAALGDAVEIASPNFIPEARGDMLAHADDYRCFAVDSGLTDTQYLTGYEVVPGTAAMVHHVLLMQVDPAKVVMDGRTNAEVMAELHEAAADRDGWPCYGLAGEKVEIAGIPVTWAPGMGVVHLPDGVGVRMSPQTQLVMQVHYNLAQAGLRGRSDITRIRLKVSPTVERPGFFSDEDNFIRTLSTDTPAELRPGEKRVEYTYQVGYDEIMTSIGAPGLDVYGVFPHMHALGRTHRVEIVRAGGTAASECAIDVPAWNFNWQRYYFYKEPLRLQAGDKMQVTCGFDTSTQTEPVLPGWGTSNEMCFLGLFLVPPKR